MKRFLVVLSLLAAGCADVGSREPSQPSLVVLCSVDQLARWVYDSGTPHFASDGGFARLLQQGTRFPYCAYAHACSETGPGHATIGTGVSAALHGIVRNTWYDPALASTVYCVAQPAAALAEWPEGSNRGPARLVAPTLGSLLKQAAPTAKVASVSWKDRSAILMGGAHADAVVWGENSTGQFVTNQLWGQQAPAWLREWNQRRVLDSYHGWMWERFAALPAYEGLVDDRPYEYAHANGSNQRTLPQPLTGGTLGPSAAFYTQMYASPIGNEVVRQVAQAAVVGMGLGKDEVTDLLCVSFSATDLIGHYFGPDSVEARDGLLRLDRTLAQWMAFLDEQVGAGRWAMYLTADHGVGPTPEWARSLGVDAGRGALMTMAKAAAEAALRKQFGDPDPGQQYCAHVGEYSIFLADATLQTVAARNGGQPTCLAASRVAATAAASTAGIAAAFATQDLDDNASGDANWRAALRAAVHPGRAGDVQLVIKPYWLDGSLPASHGTPHNYDREVVAFAIGGGAPAGKVLETPITPGFGAVWFARLLGLAPIAGASDQVPSEFAPR